MAYQFPSNPSDGDQVFVPADDGFNVYQYDVQQNTWLLISNDQINIDGGVGVVTTDLVQTVPQNPFPTPIVVNTVDDIVNLSNQREINWTIADLALNAQVGQSVQDERIQATELATQDLYSITDNQDIRISDNSALIVENRNDIVELEEELEALAPSLSRGEWQFNPNGIADTGRFTMYNSTGDITSDYNLAASVIVNPVDYNGTPHGFSDVSDGAYLEIFDPDDEDFGLFQVTDVDDQTSGQSAFWIFTVDFIKSNKSPNVANGVARFKFFELADAADPTSFVLVAGDTMEGNLTMKKSDIVFLPIADDAEGDNPDRWNYITSRRPRDPNGDLLGGSNNFGIRVDLTEGRTGYNKFQLYSNANGGPDSSFISFNGGNSPGTHFQRGSIKSDISFKINTNTYPDDSHIVFTGNNQGGIMVNNTYKQLYDEDRTYAYGRYDFQTADASDVYFQVYADSNVDTGCHVRYYGSINGAKNITTKEYVDGILDFSKYTELS